MTRYLLAILTLLSITSACSTHYYEVNNDGLHMFLKEPNANEVYFLCSLDQFEPHPAIETKPGTWEAVVPTDKEFRYFFQVDGDFFVPLCEMKESDDFGSENCIYVP